MLSKLPRLYFLILRCAALCQSQSIAWYTIYDRTRHVNSSVDTYSISIILRRHWGYVPVAVSPLLSPGMSHAICSRRLAQPPCVRLVNAVYHAPSSSSLLYTASLLPPLVPRPPARPCRPSRSFSAVARSASASASSSFASASVVPSHLAPPVALRLLSACHSVPHPASVELIVNLNLDPRKPNQSVRGSCLLPHGTGQRVTIAVFARGDKAKEALQAGADIVGAEELVERIQGGDVSFDRCLATPDCMALVGRVARVLGPRGLMPNPKLGSVSADIGRAVQQARQGQVEFKTDKGGTVHVGCGRLSFGPEKLADNVAAVARAIIAAKPSGAKGQYLRSAFLHSTHGPSVPLDIRVEPFKTNTSRAAAQT